MEDQNAARKAKVEARIQQIRNASPDEAMDMALEDLLWNEVSTNPRWRSLSMEQRKAWVAHGIESQRLKRTNPVRYQLRMARAYGWKFLMAIMPLVGIAALIAVIYVLFFRK